MGLVEKVVAIAQRLFGVLVDRDGDGLDVWTTVAFARGLLAPRCDPAQAAALFLDVVVGAAMLHKLSFVDEDLAPFLERAIGFFLAGFPGWAERP